MKYAIDLKPRAVKDLKRLEVKHAERVVAGLRRLQDDLAGDVRRLTAGSSEYRLRVGDYRVLFEVEDGDHVVVYRVAHRREVYR